MAHIRDSFFGANIVEDGDDLKVASSVVHGDTTTEINVKDLKVKLRIVDGETKETFFVEIEDAQTWDWKNPEVWRVIDGWQVTSYGSLLYLLHKKEQKGFDVVEMLQAPRFSMLSGG